MRKAFTILLFVSILAQPLSVFGSSMGLDTRYKMNMTSSSRDSEVYIPYQPVFLYPQAVSEDIFMAEGDVIEAQETDTENYSLIEGLSLNGQRIAESLFFRTGTVEIDNYYIKPLNVRTDILTAEKLKLYDGTYLKLGIHDFSNGVVLSKLFSTTENNATNNLDILELNKGGHGFELAYVKGAGMTEYEFVLIPKSSMPGNIELLLNDTILVVIGASEGGATVSPLKFSSGVDVKFSSLDEAQAYEYDGNEGTMVQTPDNYVPSLTPETDIQIGVQTEVPSSWTEGSGSVSTGIPEEYASWMKPGAEEVYMEFIAQGTSPSNAIAYLMDMGYLLTEAEMAQAVKPGAEEKENQSSEDNQSGSSQSGPSQSDADKFFEEAGMTNKLDELGNLQGQGAGVMQKPMETKPLGEDTINKPAKKQLDTSRIDLDPMTWGVSIRDGSSYGTVTTDGDQLLAEWTDEMEINITSLTGKAHEFVQRKAVRPKPIVPILPTQVEVFSASPLLAMVMLSVGGGIVFLYIITMNSYVLKVRKRIKMAEIESLKSSGGTVIGDLESFEIS